MNYTFDVVLLSALASKFIAYVHSKDKNEGNISFRNSNSILSDEDYKSKIAQKCKEIMDVGSWKEEWIGTGKINQRLIQAIKQSYNLINVNGQIEFINKLTAGHESYIEDSERVIYNLYKGGDDRANFEEVCKTFGYKYPLLAYLFFIKDDSKYLPISPVNFDKIFQNIGVDYKTAYSCGWDNYIGFLNIISEVKEFLVLYLDTDAEIRLIDAHSFLWILGQKRFTEWVPDVETSSLIEHEVEIKLTETVSLKTNKTTHPVSTFTHSKKVNEVTKKRANGICQLCGQPAPFLDREGNPYLETHHIIWLSNGGEDSTSNTAALCPNCHRKMHVVNDECDVQKLMATIN